MLCTIMSKYSWRQMAGLYEPLSLRFWCGFRFMKPYKFGPEDDGRVAVDNFTSAHVSGGLCAAGMRW
jgi:hypothetical protein